MLRLLLFGTLCFPLFSFCQNNDTIVYSIVNAGNIKGFDKYWKNADGSWGEWYQFNDRGRGDSMRIQFTEDGEGFPTSLKASGVDYMKNPVHEEFAVANGKAHWKNNAENEEKVVATKAFYTGLKAAGGHLIKALLANQNSIQLLPYGELRLRKLADHVVQNGAGPKTVTLVELSGFGFAPNYSWISQDGTDFASVNDWQSSILRGYESAVSELLQVQKKYESEFYKNLATSLPKKLPEWTVIENVAVFDSKAATVLPNRDVVIHNGVIHAVLKLKGSHWNKRGALVIDGKGKTVLPGLWDMHTHTTSDLDGILHVAAGVTHVRDMGNGPELLDRAKAFREGSVIGPRVEIMSGFIDGAGPLAAPTGVLINNLDEGLKAVRDYAAKGYQQIKIYSSVKPEWVAPMAAEAHRLHLRVCGHIPAFMTATQAINAGYDEVTHMNMLVLNFLGDTIDTRSTLRFSLPAKYAAGMDMESAGMKTFLQLLKQKNIAVDPTDVAFEGMFTARDNVTPADVAPVVSRMPLTVQRQFRAGGGGLPVPDGMDETYKKSFARFLDITKALYDNGLSVLPGTDGFAGFDLHRELELYVKAGIPAAKVLQLATLGTSTYTGKAADYGSVAAGKKADLVLVNGDPVQDIRNIRRTSMVIANGKMYDPAKLYAAISVKPM